MSDFLIISLDMFRSCSVVVCVCVCARAPVSMSQASLPTRPCWSPVHHFLCVAGSKLDMPISLCAARPSRRSPSPSAAHFARAAMNKFLPPSCCLLFTPLHPASPALSHPHPLYCLLPSSPSFLPSLLPSCPFLFTPPLDCDYNRPVFVYL